MNRTVVISSAVGTAIGISAIIAAAIIISRKKAADEDDMELEEN